MAKETLWLGYVIRKQLMGLSQIEKHSRDKKNMLKSYFLLFQKRHTWGCFEEGMGYVLTVLERPKRQGRPQLSDIGGGGLKSLHLITLKCLKGGQDPSDPPPWGARKT